MKCQKCGFENKDGSKFCLKCGNRLAEEAQSEICFEKQNIPDVNNVCTENSDNGENISGKSEQPENVIIDSSRKNKSKAPVIAISAAAVVIISAAAVSILSKNKNDDFYEPEVSSVSMTETAAQTTLTEAVTSATTAKTTVTTKQTTTQQTTTTGNGYSTENKTYKEIYSSYMKYVDTNEFQYFDLYDLDSDSVPELFLSRGMGAMCQVDILSVGSTGTVIVLGENYGAYGYVPMKGRYISSWEWMEKSGDKLVECNADLQQKLENDASYCDDIGYRYEINSYNISIAFDDFEADPTHGGDVYKFDYLSDGTNNSFLHNDPSVNDELIYLSEQLSGVSYFNNYSLYDVFTDVEAVSELVAQYSGGELSFEDFYYNCYSYYWSFGDDYGQADQFSFIVDGPGYHEASYKVYVPLEKLTPYLKDTFSPGTLPDMYSYYPGNTEGNYANFSGCVSQTDCGIPNGVIYCGGNDYTDWKVRYYYNNLWSDVWDWYDEIVVNDLSDMVLYVDGGGDYSHIYYRNSGEDCVLYRVSLDGSERIRLTDKRASNVRMYDDYIYYSSDKKFWRMNMDGSGKTKIIDAYCYLPSFYNDMIYCISSDDSCLDIYDINGGSAIDHMYLDSRPMHIDNFFIKSGILIARGYYTDNNEPFVTIRSMDDPSIAVQYSINCGGINADDFYIYMCYENNGDVCLKKTPLREFTNSAATWDYDVSGELINSYFNLVEYDAHKFYIFQADNEGIWHRFDIY